MIEYPEDILQDLIKTTDGQTEEPYSYHPWGYTIYRTCYTPESQSQWESLIEAILLGIEETIPGLYDAEPPLTSQLLLSLLRLDLRSDATLYDGLTTGDLREIYRDLKANRIPSPNFHRPGRVFLVADAKVLMDPYFLPKRAVALKEAPGSETNDVAPMGGVQKWQYEHHGWSRSSTIKKQWLKCVEVDYIYAPCLRQGPRPCLGWFGMTASSILKFWEQLLYNDFSEIMPTRNDLMIWDGY